MVWGGRPRRRGGPCLRVRQRDEGVPRGPGGPPHRIVLTHADMTAHNTFDRPEEVKLAPLPVSVRGGTVEVAIPKHAVVSIEVRLS